MSNPCPCGSQQSADACCDPILSGNQEALTALQLMRSRYVAFTRADGDYLMRSHSLKTRPVREKKNMEQWARSVSWIGLTIVGTQAGQAGDQTGYVEFKASYLEDGKLQQIHEKSLFRRENGHWVYVSGVHFS